MFDIGFSEMMVIAFVALVVIGPQRLPGVARTVGTLMGRIRRYANDVKAEVNRELQLEEVRKMQQELTAQANALGQTARSEFADISDIAADAAADATHDTAVHATRAAAGHSIAELEDGNRIHGDYPASEAKQ